MSSEHENIMDEIKEQKKKFKDMTLRQKWNYFWDYYKIPTLVIILVIIFLVTFTRDYIEGKKETMLYAVLIGANTLNDYDQLSADFADYAGIDLSQKQVIFDTSVQPGNASYEMDMASTQKMMAMASAGNMDVIIAEETSFETYADAGYYMDLRNVLSAEQLAAYGDSVYYYTYDPAAAKKEAEENGMEYEESKGPYDTLEPVPIGIRFTSFQNLPKDTYRTGGNYVFSFCISSSHTDTALTFLQYIEGK